MFWLQNSTNLCILDATMLNSLRVVCSSRTLLHRNALITNPQSGFKVCPCSAYFMSTSCPKRDTWLGITTLRAPGKEREMIRFTNQVSSIRSYIAGKVQLTCWNCTQPLDQTPAFFCLSCKVVQPPDEETSFFKIMDWWASHLLYIPTVLSTIHKRLNDDVCE